MDLLKSIELDLLQSVGWSKVEKSIEITNKIYKNHANRINNIKKQSINNKAGNSGHQRKLSFSDMFIRYI